MIVAGALPAGATNGTRAIAYGAASVQLAGSDVASGDDASQLDSNPANLGQIAGRRLDFGGVAVVSGDRHRDSLGNDRRLSNTVTPIVALGYAQRVGDSGAVAGASVHVQGGAGSVYDDLRTPAGSVDRYSSLYAVVLASVGGAIPVSDRLTVGASVSAVASAARQDLFPETSVAAPGFAFFGLETRDAKSTRPGARIGMRFQVSPEVALGAYAAPKVHLPMQGRALANLSAVGLGKVNYRSLRIDGLGVPAELAIGASWRPAERLQWSAKLERILWSGVYRTLRYTANDPDQPFAPPELRIDSLVDWRDQTVVATGLALELDDDTTLRGGLNYGTRPGRGGSTTPLLSGIDRLHVTLGFSTRVGRDWTLFGGAEILRPESITYTNPEQPFGQATLDRRYVALSLAVARRW